MSSPQVPFICLPNGQYLSEIEVEIPFQNPSSVPLPARTGNHDALLIDVSGSTWNFVKQSFENAIEHVQALPLGHFISVITFSGRHEINPVLVNIELKDSTIKDTVASELRRHAQALGLTNFSAPLQLTLQRVVERMENFGHSINIFMFTDGLPTDEGEAPIFAALTQLKAKIKGFTVFGYGPYCNADLLSRMAAAVNGTFKRGFSLDNFKEALEEFRSASEQTGDRLPLKVTLDGVIGMFSLVGSEIQQYAFEEDQETVLFTPVTYNGPSGFRERNSIEYKGKLLNKRQSLFVLSSQPPADGVECGITDKNYKGGKFERLVKAVYARAKLLCQRAKNVGAMEVMSQAGDRYFVQALSQAYTPRDLDSVERELSVAIAKPSKRMAGGFQKNCLPDENAPNLLAVLFRLQETKANWFPYLKGLDRGNNIVRLFQYNLTAREQKPVDGTPKFIPDLRAAAPVKVVIASDKPQVSLQGYFSGHVMLDERAEQFGLAQRYMISRPRTYSLVLYMNGNIDVNVDSLPVQISEEVFNELREIPGLIKGVVFPNDDYYLCSQMNDGSGFLYYNEQCIYILDLHAVSLVNRGMAKNCTDPKVLCEMVYKAKSLEGQLRVLRHHLKVAQPIEERKEAAMGILHGRTVEQRDALKAYLREFCIDPEYGFQVPSERLINVAPTDEYTALEFELVMEGFSSWSKVDDVIEKVRFTGKPLTPNEKLQAPALDELNALGIVLIKTAVVEEGKKTKKTVYQDVELTADQKAVWTALLTPRIRAMEKKLEELRNEIKINLISLLASGYWFDGVDSREDVRFEYPVSGLEDKLGFRIKLNPYTVRI